MPSVQCKKDAMQERCGIILSAFLGSACNPSPKENHPMQHPFLWLTILTFIETHGHCSRPKVTRHSDYLSTCVQSKDVQNAPFMKHNDMPYPSRLLPMAPTSYKLVYMNPRSRIATRLTWCTPHGQHWWIAAAVLASVLPLVRGAPYIYSLHCSRALHRTHCRSWQHTRHSSSGS